MHLFAHGVWVALRGTLTANAMSTLLVLDGENPQCVVPAPNRIRTWLRMHVHASALDHALAAGVSPDSSAALSLRARWLIGTSVRRRLACSVRRLLDEAQRPLAPISPAVPICRRKVLGSELMLLVLADRLAAPEAVDARGVAQVRLLLTQGDGPLYDNPQASDLEPLLRAMLSALEVSV